MNDITTCTTKLLVMCNMCPSYFSFCKVSFIFFILKVFVQKIRSVREKHYCQIALGATKLTTNSAPSTKKKIKQSYKNLDCQIITVISVLGHLYIGYTSFEMK